MFAYIQIFGRTIGMYGLCMVLGILLAGFLTIRYYKSLGQPVEDVYIVGAVGLGTAMICGNLLYIIVTYPFSYIWSLIQAGDFSFVGSGIVFYGGLIGGLVGGLFGVRLSHCKPKLFLEAVVPYIPLGHAVGRIGCLLAGCCYGMEYEGVLSVHYPNSVTGVSPEKGFFPVQPLEALLNVVICFVLLALRKKEKGKTLVLPAYLCLYAATRFGLEFLRGDENRGIYFGVSLSQWVSLGLLCVGVLWILLQFYTGKRKKSRGS